MICVEKILLPTPPPERPQTKALARVKLETAYTEDYDVRNYLRIVQSEEVRLSDGRGFGVGVFIVPLSQLRSTPKRRYWLSQEEMTVAGEWGPMQIAQIES